MKIIRQTPNPDGGYGPLQETSSAAVPEGCAAVPEEFCQLYLDMRGFVVPTITDGAVTAMAPNQAGLDAALADCPEAPASEPEPTAEDDTDAMLVDHEYRLTLLELGVGEEV